jgi:GTP1/Obg family GTP-binding protein
MEGCHPSQHLWTHLFSSFAKGHVRTNLAKFWYIESARVLVEESGSFE